MAQPHRIRLRGPWECRPLAWSDPDKPPSPLGQPEADSHSRPLPAAGWLSMPSDWAPIAGPDFRGRVQFARRFGCPTGLLEGDRVELVVEAVDYLATIELNGQPLGTTHWGQGPWRREITSLLAPANELRIAVELLAELLDRGERTGKPGGLVGEVRLEIFESTTSSETTP